MTGTLLNVSGIVAGGLLGLVKRKPLSPANQFLFKAALGGFVAFVGLRIAWMSFSGSTVQILQQLGILLLSLMLGRLCGRLLRLQKTSNRLGRHARERIAAATPGAAGRFNDGFAICTILFCAAPLGMLGAMHEGLAGTVYPLALKAVIDGLAAMSFVTMFGWGILFSAVPVLVFQGTITLLCARFLLPCLSAHALVDPVNAVCGFLLFCVALIIFEVKKVEVTDYLPSLALAPLLTWWWLR